MKEKIFNRIYTNEDCMELMSRYPDKHFDLAIVDPPYGIHDKLTRCGNEQPFHKRYKNNKWIDSAPNELYFNELFRVSKNQIIWGGNYFSKYLPVSSGWIFWNKERGKNVSYSDGEIAFSSLDRPLREIKLTWDGFRRCENVDILLHPTQKPVTLYRWLLTNYAKPGQLILDTHVGSASSLIAFEDMGFDYVACELDKGYYKLSCERLEKHRAQQKLFTPQEIYFDKENEKGLFQ